MKRLILLSDLWEKTKSDWIYQYIDVLQPHFEVAVYYSTELAEITATELSKEKLHQRFITGGIEKAIQNLLRYEKDIYAIVGFSMGGFIAWESCCAGLKANFLFTISATRIRFEKQQPATNINLYFGEKDPFIPTNTWVREMELPLILLPGQTHDMYKEADVVSIISKEIIQKCN